MICDICLEEASEVYPNGISFVVDGGSSDLNICTCEWCIETAYLAYVDTVRFPYSASDHRDDTILTARETLVVLK